MEMRQYGFQLRWIHGARAYEWMSTKSDLSAKCIRFREVDDDQS